MAAHEYCTTCKKEVRIDKGEMEKTANGWKWKCSNPECRADNFTPNEEKNNGIAVLFNNGEFSISDKDLEGTIKELKREQNYCNYGRDGATVIEFIKLYSISTEEVEQTYNTHRIEGDLL